MRVIKVFVFWIVPKTNLESSNIKNFRQVYLKYIFIKCNKSVSWNVTEKRRLEREFTYYLLIVLYHVFKYFTKYVNEHGCVDLTSRVYVRRYRKFVKRLHSNGMFFWRTSVWHCGDYASTICIPDRVLFLYPTEKNSFP